MARLFPTRLKNKIVYVLERREELDVFKTYYRANTENRINDLARSNGFEVLQLDMIVTDAVFAAIRRCHEVVHAMGVPRLSTTIKLGTRTDRTQTMDEKVRSVEKKL